MSEESRDTHGAATSEGGGGRMRLVLGATVALLLLGAGYFAWKSMAHAPAQDRPEFASDTTEAPPLQTEQIEQSQGASSGTGGASADASTATPRARAARRARPVPEQTIGITPASATTEDPSTNSDEIVVTAPRRPIWASTPSPRRLSELYPERALERGREGEARLHCIVQAGGMLDCESVSATPGGFGNAAIRVARAFRHAPRLEDGTDAVGSPVNLRVVFRMANDEHRRGRG